MWTIKKSIVLTKVLTLVMLFIFIGLMIFSKSIINILIEQYHLNPSHQTWMQVTIYVGGMNAIFILIDVYRLLANLADQHVFNAQNIYYLRRLSWLCFSGATIALISSTYFIYWGLISLFAYFLATILRIIKHVFVEAYELKQENELTI